MVKVNCDACGAPYEVDPRRIPEKGLRMRCPACSSSFVVLRDGTTQSAAQKPAQQVAAPPPARASLQHTDEHADEVDLPTPKVARPEAGKPRSAGALPAISMPPLGGGGGAPAKRIAPAFTPTEPPAAAAIDITDLPGLRGAASPLRAPDLPKPAPEGLNSKVAPVASNNQVDPFLADLPAPKRVDTPPLNFRVSRPTDPDAAPRKPIAPPISSTRPSETDLPALVGTFTQPKGDASPKVEPAAAQAPLPPAPQAAPLRPQMPSITDLPAVKVRTQDAPRPAEGGTAKRSFARPSLDSSAGLKPAELQGELPKDSLAIDPKPLFGGGSLGGLGELDDLATPRPIEPPRAPAPAPASPLAARAESSFTSAPSSAAKFGAAAPDDAIPPSEIRANRGGARTMLGLGASMPKDSLDISPGFGLPTPQPPDPEPHVLDLPAPSDLPQLKSTAPRVPDAAGSEPPELGALPSFPSLELGSEPPLGLPSAPPGDEGGFAFGELDLPAPSDLPVAKNPANLAPPELDFDLPAPSDLPTPKAAGGARHDAIDDLLSLDDAPLPSHNDGFGMGLALDEPRTSGRRAAAPANDLDDLLLPSADARPPAALGTLDLAPDDLLSEVRGRAPSAPELELGPAFGGVPHSSLANSQSLKFEQSSAGQSESSGEADSFGELDLGLELDVKGGRTAAGLASTVQRAEADLQPGEADIAAKPEKKRRAPRSAKKRLPFWAIPLGLVATTGIVGTALGAFTEHGYFGVYLLEQFLPEAGDPARVEEALGQATRLAASDTFADAKKALLVLADARNEAGLSRPLLVRSLYEESMYQLRFGDDAASAQRAAAILARIMERAPNAPGLTLARAADALRRADSAEAERLLATVPPGEGAERELLAGEIALRSNKAPEALAAFARAEQQGGGARASFGSARALVALGKGKEADPKIAATLKGSPLHADAHLLAAERALAEKKLDVAAHEAAIAAGTEALDGALAKPARAVRASAFATLGVVQESRANLREAELAYGQALAADPSLLRALIGSGRTLMLLGRPRDALSRFESALARNPGSAAEADGRIPRIDAALGAAQALLALERANEALPRLEELGKQFTENADVALWLGHAYAGAGRMPEAEDAYRRAIAIKPRDFAGYVALSQLLFKRDRTEEGARVLTEATGKVDDSADVRRLLGNSELSRNHLPEAIHQFEAALRFEPKNAGALLGLATAQRKTGALDAADATLTRLAKIDADFSGLMLERGQLLESRGDYGAAVEAYRNALNDAPNDIDLKLRLAAALVTANRLDEAERILPEVLKERPTSAEAEHFTGRNLFARGDAAAAVQHLERAVQLDTLKAEYHMYLAWALLEQGSLAPALDSANQALKRDPNLADAYWVLGRIQLRTGAVKDALKNFERTLRLKPGRYEAYANMGDAYDELRDLKQAIKSYETALRSAPERGDWWYRLGVLHLSDGGRDAARVTLSEAVLRGDRALEKPKWVADAHRAYADVLREAKRTQEAIDHYKTFLELAPAGHPDRHEIERYVRSQRR